MKKKNVGNIGWRRWRWQQHLRLNNALTGSKLGEGWRGSRSKYIGNHLLCHLLWCIKHSTPNVTEPHRHKRSVSSVHSKGKRLVHGSSQLANKLGFFFMNCLNCFCISYQMQQLTTFAFISFYQRSPTLWFQFGVFHWCCHSRVWYFYLTSPILIQKLLNLF